MNGLKSIWRVAVDGSGVIGRRAFLKAIGMGAGGLAVDLSFTDLLAARADDLRKANRAMILLWMGGGPSQMDSFDPKPDHANGGTSKAIETNVPGISLAEGWNTTAKAMDSIAVIRSMTNKEGNHQRATYQLHTGYAPSGTLKHPSFGCAIAAEMADPDFDLPQVISIGGGTIGAGFLGQGLEPFVVNTPDKPPENMGLTTSRGRFIDRLALLDRLQSAEFEKNGGADRVRDHRTLYKQTAGMVLSPRMKAFDLDGEPSPLRDAYGRNPFGQGCLLARRLVEAGVPFVEVRLGGWDNHNELPKAIGKPRDQADSAFGTLVHDLKSRGRLDRTLVVWMGEFGRTPKINPRGGRDHFPRCFSAAVAGAGIQGGQVIGSSSADGSDVKDQPVGVPDLLSSFCHALKIDPRKENMSPVGRPIKIVDGGKVVPGLFA
ncbi:MAG: DUF1501 domain-containing protein [Isosphaeraceae bacterium]